MGQPERQTRYNIRHRSVSKETSFGDLEFGDLFFWASHDTGEPEGVLAVKTVSEKDKVGFVYLETGEALSASSKAFSLTVIPVRRAEMNLLI